MKKQILSIFLILPVILLSVAFPPASVYAATFRTGDTVTVDQTLEDLYASGGTVSISAPTTNDLTVAGGTVNIDSPVTGSILAAGGTLNIKGAVGNTLRAAGGTLTVSAPVTRDALLFGGTITLDREASISGDLVINGGQVTIQSPVTGNVYVNGGQVMLNAPVGGNVEGNIENLVLGNQAVINGDLNYKSSQRASLQDGAIIRGQENFSQMEERDNDGAKIAGVITTFSFYKLIADILGSLALIYIFYRFTRRVVENGAVEPLKKGLIGLATLFLGPILGFFLLVLILPGILTFVFYGLILLLAAFISKLLVGWLILRWYYGRNNEVYILDWKAAIVGPITMFILLLIPVFGWFVGFIFYLLAIGSILSEMFTWISSPKDTSTARTVDNEKAPVRTTRPSRTVRRTTKKGR